MATRIPKNQAGFTVDEVIEATGAALVVRGDREAATSISTNTREMEPGAVFVALVGPNHDAHEHLQGAAAAGATIAIVERDVVAPPSMTILRVESTLRALGDLARVHVRRWKALGNRKLIGITGSAGKTTTRVATAALLESLFPGELNATRGNLNNRIGVPMMLASLDASHHVALLELGTSEPGEIPELCRIAQPDIGVLTLIAAAHVQGLGSIEGISAEKAALFQSLPVNGIAVGNGDDSRICQLLDEVRCERRLRWGRSSASDVRVEERTAIGMTRSRVVLRHADGRRTTFETPLVGEAGALGCAAAVATVEGAFGVRFEGEALTLAFDRVQLGEGAQRLVPYQLTRGLAMIDDAYNANPASMSLSIRTAAEMAAVMNRRLVLVLGEMCELGTEAARGHDEVGRVAANCSPRMTVVIGLGETMRMLDLLRSAGSEVLYFPTVEEAIEPVVASVQASDLVLVKGSRAVGMDRIVAELRRQHDDLGAGR